MSFKVSAQGVARRQRYVMGPKKVADPGNVVEGFELLQKLADKAKLPMSGMDEHYKMSVDALGHLTIARLLGTTLQWFSHRRAKLVVHHSKAGGLGGIWPEAEFRNEDLTFGFGGYEIAARRFVNLLVQMKINHWGYIRGLLYPMSGYALHCGKYGTKSNAASLWMNIHE